VTNVIFQPIAVENLGAFSASSSDFISAFGHEISSVSGEKRETSFLFQRLSVALQRFNAVLLHDIVLDTAKHKTWKTDNDSLQH